MQCTCTLAVGMQCTCTLANSQSRHHCHRGGKHVVHARLFGDFSETWNQREYHVVSLARLRTTAHAVQEMRCSWSQCQKRELETRCMTSTSVESQPCSPSSAVQEIRCKKNAQEERELDTPLSSSVQVAQCKRRNAAGHSAQEERA
jgi:hypothetical protein